MVSKAVAAEDEFDYVTFTAKRETCPACRKSIPLHLPARRGMLARKEGPPCVAYWHLRCVKVGGGRP